MDGEELENRSGGVLGMMRTLLGLRPSILAAPDWFSPTHTPHRYSSSSRVISKNNEGTRHKPQ